MLMCKIPHFFYCEADCPEGYTMKLVQHRQALCVAACLTKPNVSVRHCQYHKHGYFLTFCLRFCAHSY